MEANEQPATTEVLQEFFAVTTSGALWHIRNERRLENGAPFLKKLDGYGASKVPIGGFINGPAGGDGLVGITHWEGLDLYWPRTNTDGTPQRPSETTITEMRFGGHTGPIVGLFLTEQEARLCLGFFPELEKWDERWSVETQEVLEKIGKHHPMFVYDSHKRQS